MFTGSSQIITVTDPNTGQLVQQIVQTQIDPITGETKQVLSPLPASAAGLTALNGVSGGGGGGGFGGAQVVTVQDPVTGQFQQQVVGSMPMNINGGGEGRDLHKYLFLLLCSRSPAARTLGWICIQSLIFHK